MKGLVILLSVLVMVGGLSVPAYAALIDMHDGTIYDTDTQLSWLKDANYAKTSGNNANGYMTWDQAVTWAASLNAGSGFAGLTGWRLPNADPACGANYNCTKSEIGHLFYTELGNTKGGPLNNIGPFTNLYPIYYWSGTEYVQNQDFAWDFFFYDGGQDVDYKRNLNSAWAVRPGARSQ